MNLPVGVLYVGYRAQPHRCIFLGLSGLGRENNGPSKSRDMKMQDRKTQDMKMQDVKMQNTKIGGMKQIIVYLLCIGATSQRFNLV